MSLKPLKLASLLVIAASAVTAGLLWVNLSALTRKFAQEQIPGLTVREVQLAWNRVQLTDFRYVSGNSLVANLAAQSVDAHPTFLSFLGEEIEVRKLIVKSPYFRLVKQDAEVRQGSPPDKSAASSARADFKQVSLVSGKGEIEDRTVSGPPARLALDQIDVKLENLKYPVSAGSTTVDASCVIRGQPDGKVHLSGWLDPVNESADLRIEAIDIDLKNLRPYLRDRVRTIENADGTVDLNLDLSMVTGAYVVTGELTLAGLQLPSGHQARLPTLLLSQYLKLHGNRVTVPFRVTGDLRKKEHRLDFSALLSGIINQEIGNEALQKKIGLPKDLESLDNNLKDLKEKARKLRKLF